MVEEEGTRVSEKEAVLDALIEEIAQLARELTLDGSVVSSAREASHGKTLLQMEQLFLDIATDLRKRKEIRMEKYHKVNDKVIELSQEMGEEPFTIEFDGIPSDVQVRVVCYCVVHRLWIVLKVGLSFFGFG
jgi:signal recognition particle subunit SEC65